MRRRHLYVLLFALPTFLLSIIAGALLLGAAAGVLWLFVFGDNPWPSTADTLLTATLVIGTLSLWIAQLAAAYAVGKREEHQPALNKAHVLVAAGATVALVGLIALRVLGIDSAASRTDTMVCADHCLARGFASSGMPPQDSGDRTCSCYDAQGEESARIPIDELSRSR